ncbi:hypothetical protein [Neptunomonas sp. XY-337]|uniref:hypothetical protein n=1 Tax=Neptunomonas sp. XY-337 TaxID=2561897 RepID=UPI00145A0CF2|nr:hypothetical protein [Neptunomonas sp. XY-337]
MLRIARGISTAVVVLYFSSIWVAADVMKGRNVTGRRSARLEHLPPPTRLVR